MKSLAYSETYMDVAVERLEGMYQQRLASQLSQTDALYYKLLTDHYRDMRDARKMGKKLVFHTALLPTEILYAMDVVPGAVVGICDSLNSFNNTWEQALASAKAFGIASEICANIRMEVGTVLNGVVPRPDAMVMSNISCDNVAMVGDLLVRLWDCPSYYVDLPYRYDEASVAYLTRTLHGLVVFLEGLTGRKLDWDRLLQAMEYARHMMELQRELDELRKVSPALLRDLVLFEDNISFHFMGASEAVTFFCALRDEAKARVAQGAGHVREEKYRLLTVFQPPPWGWKLFDWMEREHGVTVVYEPIFAHWGSWDWDPANPLEALARKTFMRRLFRAEHGPIELLEEDIVSRVKEYNVDGVINFCNVSCRAKSTAHRLIKDKIREGAGVPYFAIEHDGRGPGERKMGANLGRLSDVADFDSETDLRDKVESFLEMIAAGRL